MLPRDTCRKCGAPVASELNPQFCTDCGADLTSDGLRKGCPNCGAELPASQSVNGCPKCGWSDDRGLSRKAKAAAIVCALIIAVSAGVLLAQFSKGDLSIGSFSSGSGGGEAASETTSYSAASATSSDIEADGEEGESGASAGQDTSGKAPVESSAINLSNKEEYGAANLFLSNFAELPRFWADDDYEGDNPDWDKIVDWGFWHYGINNGVLLRGSTDVAGLGTFHWKLDTAGVEKAVENYLGLDCNLKDYQYGNFAEKGGIFYAKSNDDVSRDCYYVALLQSATDLSGGTVEATFAIVTTSQPHQMVSDSSWYSMSVDELAAAMSREYGGDSVRMATGTAELALDGVGNERSFTLLQLIMDRDRFGNIVWSDLN